jgi:hypothetical protein
LSRQTTVHSISKDSFFILLLSKKVMTHIQATLNAAKSQTNHTLVSIFCSLQIDRHVLCFIYLLLYDNVATIYKTTMLKLYYSELCAFFDNRQYSGFSLNDKGINRR